MYTSAYTQDLSQRGWVIGKGSDLGIKKGKDDVCKNSGWYLTVPFRFPKASFSPNSFYLFSQFIPALFRAKRWEFIKGSMKVRKQENKISTQKAIKKTRTRQRKRE